MGEGLGKQTVGHRRVVPFTLVVILANAVLVVLGYVFGSLRELLAMDPAKVWDGQVWRVFTYAWVHSGLFHFLGNMVAFLPFAAYTEIRWGRARLVTAYLLGCLGSGVVLLLFRQQAVGASGAVASLMALWLAGVLHRRGRTWFAAAPEFILGVLVGVFYIARLALGDVWRLGASDNVAHWGHLGGFLTGYLLFRAGLLSPRLRAKEPGKLGEASTQLDLPD